MYTTSPNSIIRLVENRSANCPNANAQGIPTNWTITSAPIISACPRPISLAYAAARLIVAVMPLA
ncbi:MAG: hypothetical protein J07HX64_00582 [halophilic archaeon J07HX64]|nr:MAG: hypothetical protein J07HX64_00582 [halophilic archaeon J07HX64]